jgi:hypothetical protein
VSIAKIFLDEKEKMRNMEITINKEKHLSQIQEEFHRAFPFLKLEFYSSFHKSGEGSNKKNALDSKLTVEDVCKTDAKGSITIGNTMKVSELEKIFKDTFGLSVQVFRKSNNLWLQTTITDSWPLSKQNQNAMEMSEQENLKEEPEDYHEQK